MTPLAVLAERQAVDERSLEELVADEAAALGIDAEVRWYADGFTGALRSLDSRAVALPAPGTAVLGGADVVRVDLELTEPDETVPVHIQGRGIDGVRWALRAVHHRSRWPVESIAYGPHREQFGELRLPASRERAPVVVLLHGGFWRSRWQLDLMDALAVDLAERGIASWNVEYRRPDRHGWQATVADVEAAVTHAAALGDTHGIEAGRVALVGHSAGGQLALQVARLARPDLVVSLAGLVDLVGTHRRDLGYGAVPTALGGTPEQVPETYRRACPLLAGPTGVRQLLVIGTADSPDLREMNRRYLRVARDGRDDVELLEDAGDHFSVIAPSTTIWRRTAEHLATALGADSVGP